MCLSSAPLRARARTQPDATLASGSKEGGEGSADEKIRERERRQMAIEIIAVSRYS